MTIDLSAIAPPLKVSYLQAAVCPRPIALASTIDREGHINLSPFSFFNIFSINPPVVIFSASRRVRDNSVKHTLENVLEVPEVVINLVDYDMVQQVSLSSCEFPKGVNEFEKAGFTALPSEMVKPPRVRESKIQMECRVIEVKALGDKGGSGNLIICEVLRMHLSETILNEKGLIDPTKMHHVARLGGDWYSRVDSTNLFQVEKPNTQLGIGVDNLPPAIRNSRILTGNNLGQLANVQVIPDIDPAFDDPQLKNIFQYFGVNPEDMENELHRLAKTLLDQGKTAEAWQVLLALNQ